jgi:hypothetical protein
VNFYKIFIKERQKKHSSKKDNNNNNSNNSNISSTINPSYANNTTANVMGGSANNGDNANLYDENNPEKNENGEAQIQDNIEISESTELEYEIRIPQFLHDYVSTINRRETKSDFRQQRTNTMENSEMKDLETLTDHFEENDNLVDENSPKQTAQGNPQINKTPNNMNIQRFNFNKQTDEDKEFQSKINQYRSLFETGRFSELEELIEKVNTETATREFKFNYTFSVYRYGENQIAYVIRCIDNKSEFDFADSSNETGNGNNSPGEKNFTSKHLKSKQVALKDLNEITYEEKREITEKSNDYLKLSLEEKDFFRIQVFFKEEIANHSKIFGVKKEENRKIFFIKKFIIF